jgi:hypothetical protein
MGIAVPFGWASEMIPEFQSYREGVGDYVVFYIWLGNKKQQGYQIFNKPLAWEDKKSLVVNGKQYELEISFNIKFSHFNRFVSAVTFSDDVLKKPLHTADNFYHKSGKWQRELWGEFELFMDDHFKRTLTGANTASGRKSF